MPCFAKRLTKLMYGNLDAPNRNELKFPTFDLCLVKYEIMISILLASYDILIPFAILAIQVKVIHTLTYILTGDHLYAKFHWPFKIIVRIY